MTTVEQLGVGLELTGEQAVVAGLNRTDAAVQRTHESIQRSAAGTKQLESAFVSLGSSINPLPGQFNAVSNAAVGLGGINPVVAGAAVGVGALAAGLAAAGNTATQFEHAMTQVRAVLSPAEIAASGGALRDLALQLGQSGLGFTATEAATGLEAMAKAGISVQDQMTGASSVLQLAAAGGLKVGEAADFAANTMAVFNLRGTDMAHVANLMAGAANATTADVADLRLAMQQFGAVANLTGQTVDSATTAIALMAQAGIKGSDAGTSLKTMFLNLQPTTQAQKAEFERLGLSINGVNQFINQETGSFKQAGDIATILHDRLAGLTDAQKAASLEIIFGSDAIRASAVLTKAGAEGWASLTTEMGKVSAADVARERLNDLTGSVKNLQASTEVLAVGLVSDFTPSLRGVVDAATEGVKAIEELRKQAAQGVPVVQRGAAEVGGGVAGNEAAAVQALAAAGAAQLPQVGIDWGHVLLDAMALPLTGGAGLLVGSLVEGLGVVGAEKLGEEGKRIGADFSRNVAAALLAESPSAEAAMGGIAERLVAEFKGRGFSDEQAREAAQLYMTAVADEMERQRPGITAAAAGVGEAVAAGIDAARPAVVDASARIASEIGAALQANKGNIEAAMAEILTKESGPAAEQAIAQILQRANAYKAVGEALNTLTPSERAHYEAMLLANGANDKVNQSLTVLNSMRDQGKITQEQYNSAIERGSLGLQTHAAATGSATTATNANTAAVRDAKAAQDALNAVSVEYQTNLLLQQNANAGTAEALRSLDLATAAQVQAMRNAGDVYGANRLALTALGATEEEATRVVYGYASAHDVLAEAAFRATGALREQQAAAAQGPGAAGIGAGGAFTGPTSFGPALGVPDNGRTGVSGPSGGASTLYGPDVLRYIQEHPENAQAGVYAPANLSGAAASQFALGNQWALLRDQMQIQAEAQAAETVAAKDHTAATQQGTNAALHGAAALSDFQTNIVSASDANAAMGDAFSHGGQKLVAFTAGTGLATNQVVLFGDATAEAAKVVWAAAVQQAQALREGTAVIAGFKTAVGLNTSQIYGNTATQGTGSGGGGTNQGIVNLNPGNYYGLPVVSPLTGGTLRGFANGGMVYEPSYIVPTRTGIPSAIMAERGPEAVGGGGSVNVQIVVQAGIGASDEVSARPFWNKVSQDHLVPILRSLGR